MNDIRKIAVGPDYKSGAMHYVVGQEILKSTYTVHHIRYDESSDSFKIWIQSIFTKEIVMWKQFVSMPVSVEYNINF
mgnify:FL=1|jgi:hypothetical protein|tara:strand:- start:218 stop:448 length:231 start_codon:yes stop_codon:yes gene_type:complete